MPDAVVYRKNYGSFGYVHLEIHLMLGDGVLLFCAHLEDDDAVKRADSGEIDYEVS